jgi:hypothetical protein
MKYFMMDFLEHTQTRRYKKLTPSNFETIGDLAHFVPSEAGKNFFIYLFVYK